MEKISQEAHETESEAVKERHLVCQDVLPSFRVVLDGVQMYDGYTQTFKKRLKNRYTQVSLDEICIQHNVPRV